MCHNVFVTEIIHIIISLIHVFSPQLCLASVFKWAMLFNSVFRKIPSHSMVWATLHTKCHNGLTKQLQPTSKRGQTATKTLLWDQEIACRPPMNWLAWNEPPPETQTEKEYFCKDLRYHMISHSQLRPRTSCCILKSFFSRPGSPVKHDPGWEGNMIKQIKQIKYSTQLWGKDEMMSTEAAVSRSLPRFAATTISLAHGPPTGISCHLSLASVITSIISLYILCYLVTTVYQQGSLNCLYSEEQTKETEGRRMRVTPQIASEVGCLGNPLVTDLPPKLPFHHNTAIVEEQTMPARYDVIRYDDIKRNEMQAMNIYESA